MSPTTPTSNKMEWIKKMRLQAMNKRASLTQDNNEYGCTSPQSDTNCTTLPSNLTNSGTNLNNNLNLNLNLKTNNLKTTTNNPQLNLNLKTKPKTLNGSLKRAIPQRKTPRITPQKEMSSRSDGNELKPLSSSAEFVPWKSRMWTKFGKENAQGIVDGTESTPVAPTEVPNT